MRKKIIAGNWKMNNTISKAETFIEEIKERINVEEVDVVVCPNFVSLDRVGNCLEGTNIKLGAQNVYFEDKGAFTGETAADMLLAVGVNYCIVGHSERRTYFNETNEIVNKKVKKLLENTISPILCVGETLEQRNTGILYDFIETQVIESLKDVTPEQVKNQVVIAYEPIWAIGTGVTASVEQANEMCHFIREVIKKQYGEAVAQQVRIQYGGSVTATNASQLLNSSDIDGALVGGASLKNDFVAIVNY